MFDKPRLAAGLTLGAFALVCLAGLARFAPDAAPIAQAEARPARTAEPAGTRTPAEVPWGAIAARLQMGN
ncbi:hypothetical protein [Falsiroseomonas sp. HW251]|uniref:hypothetical protein n=1 Tax=Falsiroseomonas sp. HW251 TaxID=3390998 RepID=UPI003D30F7C4